MKKLSLTDDAFLRLESRSTPLHIGMLMLFEPPEDAPADFAAKLFKKLSRSNHAAEPFNRLLVRKRGMHYWKEDEDFDLGQHFVHTALPQPGRIRELFELISRVHCAHLDRNYPLWRMYFIEGLEDGRIAVYMKVHHSLVDGVAGMRAVMNAMSTDRAESETLPAMWEVTAPRSRAQVSPVPQASLGGLAAVRALAREGIKSLYSPLPLLKELRSTITDYRNHKEDVVIGMSPRCALVQPISSTRRFAAQSYSRVRIKKVAKAFDATTNDVVLAMCGGAIRHYLMELNDLPDRPIMAGVPISIRKPGSDFGNEVSFTAAHLGTNIEDAGDRMRAIKRCMDDNKKHMSKLSPGQFGAYSAIKMMPGVLNSVFKFAPDCMIGGVVVSNVPGPQQDMYWQGARLSGLYPLSLLLDGNALNITLITRHDSVDFGLIACRKSVPHMQRLLDYLEEALGDLEVAAEQHAASLSVAGEGAADAPTTSTKAVSQAANKPVKKRASSATAGSAQSRQSSGASPAKAAVKKTAARRKVTARSHKKVAKAKSA